MYKYLEKYCLAKFSSYRFDVCLFVLRFTLKSKGSEQRLSPGEGRDREALASKTSANCHTFVIKNLRNLDDQWCLFLEVRQHVKPLVIG